MGVRLEGNVSTSAAQSAQGVVGGLWRSRMCCAAATVLSEHQRSAARVAPGPARRQPEQSKSRCRQQREQAGPRRDRRCFSGRRALAPPRLGM